MSERFAIVGTDMHKALEKELQRLEDRDTKLGIWEVLKSAYPETFWGSSEDYDSSDLQGLELALRGLLGGVDLDMYLHQVSVDRACSVKAVRRAFDLAIMENCTDDSLCEGLEYAQRELERYSDMLPRLIYEAKEAIYEEEQDK